MSEKELLSHLRSLFEKMGKLSMRLIPKKLRLPYDIAFEEFDANGESFRVAVIVKSGISKNIGPKKLIGQILKQLDEIFSLDSEGSRVFDKALFITTQERIGNVLVPAAADGSLGKPDRVSFWDRDKLWSMLQQYIGPATVISSIKDILNQAGLSSDQFELILNPTGRPTYGYVESEGIRLYIAPKTADAGPLPITLSTRVQDWGAFAEVMTHGGALSFGEGQARIDYPEPLSGMVGDGMPLTEVRVTPLQQPPRFNDLRVVFRDADRGFNFSDRFGFFLEDGFVRINNQAGNSLHKMSFRFPWPVTSETVKDSSLLEAKLEKFKFTGVTVQEALTSARIVQILRSPGSSIHLLLKSDNSHLASFHGVKIPWEGDGLGDVLEALEMFHSVEQLLHLELRVPQSGITLEDVNNAKTIATAVKLGRVNGIHPGTFRLSFDPKLYTEGSVPENFSVPYESNHRVSLLGQDVELGPTILEIRNSRFIVLTLGLRGRLIGNPDRYR